MDETRIENTQMELNMRVIKDFEHYVSELKAGRMRVRKLSNLSADGVNVFSIGFQFEIIKGE